MNRPPDTKKGAIPLDRRSEPASEAGQAEAGKETGEAASETIPDRASEPASNAAAAQICPMLSSVYNMARDGRVKAMMMCFIDDSGVPQLGYYVGPNQAVPMLGGVMMAEDALKEGAKRTMEGYSDFLRKKAEHDQQTSKNEPGQGEQVN